MNEKTLNTLESAGVLSSHNPLGQATVYKDTYDASLLHPIPRDESWKHEGKARPDIPYGLDIWNGWEMSWLNASGKPVVAIGEFRIPHSSDFLVESKSFKLYLNSWNQTRVENTQDMVSTIEKDLSAVAGAPVSLSLQSSDSASWPQPPEASCIDDLDIRADVYLPDATLLKSGSEKKSEWLCSHLLKSNCPVTGQPDWGSVYLYYEGAEIQKESLLAYLISMRQHQGFHEQCVEQIYQDLMAQCELERLWLCARYVRRGGLDINPVRSSHSNILAPEQLNFRTHRQ